MTFIALIILTSGVFLLYSAVQDTSLKATATKLFGKL